jgi:hypothetical protein
MRKLLVLGVLLAAVTGVAWGTDTANGIEDPLDYIDDAVDALQETWVGRYEMDWDMFVADVCSGLDMTASDFDPALVVEHMVTRLQWDFCDWHASFNTAEELAQGEAASSQFVADFEAGLPTSDGFAPCGGIVDAKVAYVWVPGTSFSAAGWLTTDYIVAKGTELLRVVDGLDETAPRGWVIDLRQHYGGSVGAGLLGLQALLPEGRLFGFSYPHEGGVLTTDAWVERQGAQFVWVYRDSGGVQTESVIAGISARPRGFRDPNVPIAVLTSASTASAGEALLVALRQNLRVRVFGEATSGINTGRDAFMLPDGSALIVSTSYLADPDGHIYRGTGETYALDPWGPTTYCLPGERIAPDVVKAVPHWGDAQYEAERMRTLGPQAYMSPRYDPAYQAALAWIRGETTP